MNRKSNGLFIGILLIAAICVSAGCYHLGHDEGRNEIIAQQEKLYELNRSSISAMSTGEETVYVVGHMSPDSDTVCSAIAYARLLNLLGFKAEARINGPVNKETAFILAQAEVQIPEVLNDADGKNLFLVDHSEYAQGTPGLEGAHIVGIIDHHGVGSVITGHQIVYEARPIGSTATIIWLDYLNYGLKIDRQTAHILLGAVLSDTDNLTGSTTTEADRQAVRSLSEIAGISDVDSFYHDLHAEKLSYEGMDPLDILFSDYKEYEAAGVRFGIGLLSAIDEETAKKLAEKMKECLPDGFRGRDVELMYAAVSIRENGEKIDYIIPTNEISREIFVAAFPDYDEFDGTSYIFRTGLGRKTKFVPGLTDYLTANVRE